MRIALGISIAGPHDLPDEIASGTGTLSSLSGIGVATETFAASGTGTLSSLSGTGVATETLTLVTLPGLQLWVHGDAPPSGTTWADQSGGGHNLTAANAGVMPVLSGSTLNGHGYVHGDGVDDKMTATFTSVQPQHVFLVARYSNNAASQTIIDGLSINTMRQVLSAGQNNVGMVAPTFVAASSGSATSWRVYSMQFNGASSHMLDNGVQTLSGNVGTGGSGAGGVTLWAAGSSVQFTAADIAELGITTTLPSATDEANYAAALKTKYGL